ncbi:hypothetical protein lerEdw1_016289 [Lerista edwardsae]|nr:hypothetical protein lerEdw1_016289 [Lerista edwardsae]
MMEPRMPHNITVVPNATMVQPLLDSRIPYGRLQHPLTILPIDQMKTTHMENDYIDNPTIAQLAAQKPSRAPPRTPPPAEMRARRHAPVDLVQWEAQLHQQQQQHILGSKAFGPHGARPSGRPELDKHFLLCEACGKCKCKECALPRTLPSCWVCNQECLCSAQNLVNYSTCMCLVKGVFYHCTNEDDEGSCADHPCSCSHSNCCARWSFMSALSLVLPCLLCYLPATGCVKLSQRCYDQVSRPGCRCKNTNSVICKASPEGKVGSRPEKPF